MKILVTLAASVLLALAACSADPVTPGVPDPASNSLNLESGLCGHQGQPCCLGGEGHDFWESTCEGGSTCVGADLGCTKTDGDDLATPPAACGICGDPNKKYKDFCDAAFLYIDTQCQWQADCGFFTQDFVPTCTQFFAPIAQGRCGTPITSSDAKIDRCLAEWDGFSCADRNALPADCDMFFFGNDKP